MASTVYVINPNSTRAVTAGISAAVEPLRVAGGPAIECLTLEAGPPGIQSQADADSVTQPLLALARSLPSPAAIVVACFSDPGLHLLREALPGTPVLGISECGVLTALTLGHRFGVIAILQGSIPRHLRYYGAMGVGQRFAGEVAVGLGVTELGDRERTVSRMVDCGRRLREQHGADVLVMGCAGMAAYRDELQQAVGVPVVEPTQAATAMAIGRAQLRWERPA
jgi:Asp/Glu/hydantoin racemase